MDEIEDAVRFVMASEKERRLLEVLVDGPCSFTDLMNGARIGHKMEVTRGLHRLSKFMVLDHVYDYDRRGGSFSFYKLNARGDAVVSIVRDLERRLQKSARAAAKTTAKPRIAFRLEQVKNA